jgi:hypothetical protein
LHFLFHFPQRISHCHFHLLYHLNKWSVVCFCIDTTNTLSMYSFRFTLGNLL